MADAYFTVELRRLGSDLRDLKTILRKNYPKADQQVMANDLRERASRLAESWLANFSQRPELARCVSEEFLGDLSVHFQRILVYAEHATIRGRYDTEITAVLRDYTTQLVVPLMQDRQNRPLVPAPQERPANQKEPAENGFQPSAFVGHSFAAKDLPIVNTVIDCLRALGIRVETGQKPRANQISEKVKHLIDDQHIFVGIFTCRDKIEGKKLWTTSPWVLDEKAYALGKNRKLVLLKETGVDSIGGIQGDYEFIEFSRHNLHGAIVGLIQLFVVSVGGLRP